MQPPFTWKHALHILPSTIQRGVFPQMEIPPPHHIILLAEQRHLQRVLSSKWLLHTLLIYVINKQRWCKQNCLILYSKNKSPYAKVPLSPVHVLVYGHATLPQATKVLCLNIITRITLTCLKNFCKKCHMDAYIYTKPVRRSCRMQILLTSTYTCIC